MKPPASCVLIADDEFYVCELLRDFLIGEGYAVVMVTSGVEAPEAPCAPELRLLHRWLDRWTGVRPITVGVEP